MERTLAIIKPDGVERNLIGTIIARIEAEDLKVVKLKMVHLSREEAGEFYAVHRERPFYNSLCEYLSSGPIVVMALEGKEAISRWRQLMGATDPSTADEGTLRREYALNIERNTVHGSDAPETAAVEIGYMFKD